METPMEHINLDLIDENPYQPRQLLNPDETRELADDLLEKWAVYPETMGLMQVPTARPHPTEPGRYQIAFGHRRFAAFRHNAQHSDDWNTMPLNVKHLDNETMYELAATENSKRVDVNDIEKAYSIQTARDELGWTLHKAAQAHGLSDSAASNLCRLLRLPEPVIDMIYRGEITQRAGRELLKLEALANEEYIIQIAHEIQGLTTDLMTSYIETNIYGLTYNSNNDEPEPAADPVAQAEAHYTELHYDLAVTAPAGVSLLMGSNMTSPSVKELDGIDEFVHLPASDPYSTVYPLDDDFDDDDFDPDQLPPDPLEPDDETEPAPSNHNGDTASTAVQSADDNCTKTYSRYEHECARCGNPALSVGMCEGCKLGDKFSICIKCGESLDQTVMGAENAVCDACLPKWKRDGARLNDAILVCGCGAITPRKHNAQWAVTSDNNGRIIHRCPACSDISFRISQKINAVTLGADREVMTMVLEYITWFADSPMSQLNKHLERTH